MKKKEKLFQEEKGLQKVLSNIFGETQREILGVLSQEQERRILLYLVERSSCTQKELVKYTGVSASTINWHMKRLIDARLVNAKREAQFVRYELAVEKERVLKLLIIQEFGKDLQKLYPK